MSKSRTVRLFGLARGLQGGATRFDNNLCSDYNGKIKYLSNSIFGDFKKPGLGSYNNWRLMYSMISKPLYERPEIVQYYPPHEKTGMMMAKLRRYGLYRDEHKDFIEEMERRRNKRGKSKFARSTKDADDAKKKKKK